MIYGRSRPERFGHYKESLLWPCNWTRSLVSHFLFSAAPAVLSTGQQDSERLSQLSLRLTLMWLSGADRGVHLCVCCLVTTVGRDHFALQGQAKKGNQEIKYVKKQKKNHRVWTAFSNAKGWKGRYNKKVQWDASCNIFCLSAKSKDDTSWHMETGERWAWKPKWWFTHCSCPSLDHRTCSLLKTAACVSKRSQSCKKKKKNPNQPTNTWSANEVSSTWGEEFRNFSLNQRAEAENRIQHLVLHSESVVEIRGGPLFKSPSKKHTCVRLKTGQIR